MTKQKKKAILETMTPILAQNHLYIVDCQGLTANQSHMLRGMLYEENIRCRVIPNTLLNRMLKDTESEKLTEVLKNTSMVLMTDKNPSAPAKVLGNFHKKVKLNIPLLKGAFAYGEIFIGEEQLKPLTKLKSKEELIGEIITLLESPVHQLMGALQSGKDSITGLLKTLADR